MTTKRQRGRTVTDAIARYPLERLATAQSIRDEHRAEMDEAAAQLPVKVRLADGRTLLSEGPSSGGRAYRCMDGIDRKSTRLNSSHIQKSRMPSSA